MDVSSHLGKVRKFLRIFNIPIIVAWKTGDILRPEPYFAGHQDRALQNPQNRVENDPYLGASLATVVAKRGIVPPADYRTSIVYQSLSDWAIELLLLVSTVPHK